MKKIFVFVMCLSVCVNLIASKSFNYDQLALRQNIFDFLKEEGFVPSIDSDGDILFKTEGSKYYVIVSEVSISPMYVVLYHGFNYSDVYTKNKIEKLVNEINMYKSLKILPQDDAYSFRVEMYLVNAEHFRYTFYKHLEIMKEARKKLISLIEEM